MPTSQGSRVFNTHVIISGSGVIEAAYRKIHLFDVVSTNAEDLPSVCLRIGYPKESVGCTLPRGTSAK